ncbi:hypothetical protein AAY81_08415 [Denitrobacterium detoxificans]|uniref:Regulatory protein, luxR family n=1 Tax=Denitrobacterium detoxificans TaxID=79604 RepID=A0A172RZI4_9ACTN|nr:LuxR C-terminal-related transcriptional regulator [Denitrobacterium detoxificans]ANE23126.1 hypothetical protein AAY81_08415 [Denitrobacterium detoxificans]SEO53963.1 regulatory protein, luxR family [Denitrobacterium detoxificans]
MTEAQKPVNELSSRRIVGFACNQGFVFFLFYMGLNRPLDLGAFSFERADLAFVLLFMVVGFGVPRALPHKARETVLARPFMFVYAAIMAIASLLPTLFPDAPQALVVAEGALIGIPNSLLLTGWGRSFGRVSTRTSVPEVFTGSLLGAFLCVVFSFVTTSEMLIAIRLLPIISALYIYASDPGDRAPLAANESVREQAGNLTLKILSGTLLFGMAAGLMETFGTDPGTAASPHYQLSMVLFGAFLIGSISLLTSDGFGKGAALNKTYRLAVFLMLFGTLMVPLAESGAVPLPGDAVVLAGYLGLEAVLISLFLVMASIEGIDAFASFSVGFTALFAGELAGVLVANGIDAAWDTGTTPYVVVVIAGTLVLLSYVFLFGERDFSDLSEIVTDRDEFDLVCTHISNQAKLSKREAEILPYALHGRTSERIATELGISKSTVDTHLRRIYGKTGVHSRQELIDLGEKIGKKLS